MSEATATLDDEDVEAVSVKTIEEVLANGMQQWLTQSDLTDRRMSPRVPFLQKICLIGLDEQHRPDCQACLVDGRDISADGISFKHFDMLREYAATHCGYDVPPSQIGWPAMIYVAETDKQAREEFEPPLSQLI